MNEPCVVMLLRQVGQEDPQHNLGYGVLCEEEGVGGRGWGVMRIQTQSSRAHMRARLPHCCAPLVLDMHSSATNLAE